MSSAMESDAGSSLLDGYTRFRIMIYGFLSRFVALQCLFVSVSIAQSLDEISNYLEYSDRFASAGQPTETQLELIGEAGFERVINIAFSTDGNALASEDRLVKDLGMEYIHIPVIWNRPTPADYESFAAVMSLAPEKKTLLHCQVNMRASAFAFLYRVLEQGVPMAQAKADMSTIWDPNETWRDLIFEVLAVHGVSPECDGCDW